MTKIKVPVGITRGLLLLGVFMFAAGAYQLIVENQLIGLAVFIAGALAVCMAGAMATGQRVKREPSHAELVICANAITQHTVELLHDQWIECLSKAPLAIAHAGVFAALRHLKAASESELQASRRDP